MIGLMTWTNRKSQFSIETRNHTVDEVLFRFWIALYGHIYIYMAGSAVASQHPRQDIGNQEIDRSGSEISLFYRKIPFPLSLTFARVSWPRSFSSSPRCKPTVRSLRTQNIFRSCLYSISFPFSSLLSLSLSLSLSFFCQPLKYRFLTSFLLLFFPPPCLSINLFSFILSDDSFRVLQTSSVDSQSSR